MLEPNQCFYTFICYFFPQDYITNLFNKQIKSPSLPCANKMTVFPELLSIAGKWTVLSKSAICFLQLCTLMFWLFISLTCQKSLSVCIAGQCKDNRPALDPKTCVSQTSWERGSEAHGTSSTFIGLLQTRFLSAVPFERLRGECRQKQAHYRQSLGNTRCIVVQQQNRQKNIQKHERKKIPKTLKKMLSMGIRIKPLFKLRYLT